MSEDLRCHHDVEVKRKAIELIGRGCGYGAAPRALGLPNDTVRGWLYIAQAVGIEDFLDGKKRYASYAFETKLAAARAVVDEGMTKADAMAAFGIASLSPVSVNLFFTSFAKQAHRSRKGGFTGCANVFSPIPVTA